MCTYLNRTGSKYYFRRPVPKDLLGFFRTERGGIRTEWKFSLGTTERAKAKSMLHTHAIETDRLIAEARASIEAVQLEPGFGMSAREAEEAEVRAALEEARHARYKARSDYRKAWREKTQQPTANLRPEEAAAMDLLREKKEDIDRLKAEVAALKARSAQLVSVSLPAEALGPASLTSIFDAYVKASGMRPTTARGWRSHIMSFIAHTGIDDASAIQLHHILSWIDWLRQRPGRNGNLTEKTIRQSYLAALKSTLAYGVTTGALARNVAREVKLLRIKKRPKLRERDFSQDERLRLLRAAMTPQSARASHHVKAARRWVPWLCAYTGARVGEILQLRKQDIRIVDGLWAIHLTPEAGDMKTDEQRWVPLHDHLIEQGFTDWAQNQAERLFFPEVGTCSGRRISKPYQTAYNRLREWIRLHVPDPLVQPNHAWRHTFKTLARDHGLVSEVVDAIQGHQPATVGKTYGSISLMVRKREIDKLPRFKIEPENETDNAREKVSVS